MPNYFINAEIGYAIQKMHVICVGWFSIKNHYERVCHVDLEDQSHYKDKFGIKKNEYDFGSGGAYQPKHKIGVYFFRKWESGKWANYFFLTPYIKYRWHNKMRGNVDAYNYFQIAMVPNFVLRGKLAYTRHRDIPRKTEESIKDLYRKKTRYKRNKKRDVFLY